MVNFMNAVFVVNPDINNNAPAPVVICTDEDLDNAVNSTLYLYPGSLVQTYRIPVWTAMYNWENGICRGVK